MVPSFLTNIFPVPDFILVRQKEHFIRINPISHYLSLNLPADSISVSRSMSISFTLTAPITFLVNIFPLFGPSRTLHLTCTIPFTPDRPKICRTSAGCASTIKNHSLGCPIFAKISLNRSLPSPTSVIPIAAQGTSIPAALPNSILLGT